MTSLAVIKSRQDAFTGRRTQHDALVLAFRDAKLSVVEWDDDEQTLRTRLAAAHKYTLSSFFVGFDSIHDCWPSVASSEHLVRLEIACSELRVRLQWSFHMVVESRFVIEIATSQRHSANSLVVVLRCTSILLESAAEPASHAIS